MYESVMRNAHTTILKRTSVDARMKPGELKRRSRVFVYTIDSLATASCLRVSMSADAERCFGAVQLLAARGSSSMITEQARCYEYGRYSVMHTAVIT